MKNIESIFGSQYDKASATGKLRHSNHGFFNTGIY